MTVRGVTEELQQYFGFPSSGARSPEIPKQAWVREALDALVDFKMSEFKGNGEYVIRYRRGRTDTLQRFGRLCFQRQLHQSSHAEGQFPLFPEPTPKRQ